MKTKTVLLVGLVTLIAALAYAAPKAAKTAKPAVDAAAAFDRLKSLAGEWEATSAQGKAHISIELIANGTALVEKEVAEGMQPMLTVYTVDGNRLLLTHYCMAGNQPRMQAQSFDPASGEIDFAFLDAGNLTSPAAGHMHNVHVRVVDNDHLVSTWEFYENGKKKFGEAFQYSRVK